MHAYTGKKGAKAKEHFGIRLTCALLCTPYNCGHCPQLHSHPNRRYLSSTFMHKVPPRPSFSKPFSTMTNSQAVCSAMLTGGGQHLLFCLGQGVTAAQQALHLGSHCLPSLSKQFFFLSTMAANHAPVTKNAMAKTIGSTPAMFMGFRICMHLSSLDAGPKY